MNLAGSELKELIRDVPDYPKKGVVFKDITPLLANPLAFSSAIEAMSRPYLNKEITKVVCVEARGFIFGSAVASHLKKGFVPVRKKGKLPYKTRDMPYQLEYGKDVLCIHEDALGPDDKVLIVDDLLATGGTVDAAVKLIHGLAAKIIGASFLIDLSFLGGRDKLSQFPITSIIDY